MNTAVHYPIIVQRVQEISLLGAADLDFWRAQLRAHNLFPFSHGGRAQILISATSLRWKNIPSRECTFAVMVSRRADETTRDGSFLLHAFNSRRLFALVERKSFSAPYYHAALEVELKPPRFQARLQAETVIRAARKNNAPAQTRNETLETPVFLPPLTHAQNAPPKFFVVKLTGATRTIPFAADDEFTLQPSAHAAVIQHLCQSNFTPTEWYIRADATHCKSNTFVLRKDSDAFTVHS